MWGAHCMRPEVMALEESVGSFKVVWIGYS